MFLSVIENVAQPIGTSSRTLYSKLQQNVFIFFFQFKPDNTRFTRETNSCFTKDYSKQLEADRPLRLSSFVLLLIFSYHIKTLACFINQTFARSIWLDIEAQQRTSDREDERRWRVWSLPASRKQAPCVWIAGRPDGIWLAPCLWIVVLRPPDGIWLAPCLCIVVLRPPDGNWPSPCLWIVVLRPPCGIWPAPCLWIVVLRPLDGIWPSPCLWIVVLRPSDGIWPAPCLWIVVLRPPGGIWPLGGIRWGSPPQISNMSAYNTECKFITQFDNVNQS